jgi:hypothetical protein
VWREDASGERLSPPAGSTAIRATSAAGGERKRQKGRTALARGAVPANECRPTPAHPTGADPSTSIAREVLVLRSALAAVTLLALLGCAADPPAAPGIGDLPTPARSSTSQGIARVQRVGTPVWRPVDFHLFSAYVGTAASGYAEAIALFRAVMPPPEHVSVGSFLIGPGTPHAPPYDRELAAGLAALGYEDQHTFSASQFSAPGQEILPFWTLVPDPGVTGRSADFASGPIIPNALFPVVVNGTAYRNGELFDPQLFDGPFLTPALDGTVDPRFIGVEGHSHVSAFTGIGHYAALDPTVPVAGNYTYEITMRDQAGNGWHVTVHDVEKKKS